MRLGFRAWGLGFGVYREQGSLWNCVLSKKSVLRKGSQCRDPVLYLYLQRYVADSGQKPSS